MALSIDTLGSGGIRGEASVRKEGDQAVREGKADDGRQVHAGESTGEEADGGQTGGPKEAGREAEDRGPHRGIEIRSTGEDAVEEALHDRRDGTAVRGSVAGAVAAVDEGCRPAARPTRSRCSKPTTGAWKVCSRAARRRPSAPAQGRRELLDELTTELTVHELIEEQVLYPALQSHP